MKMKNKVFVLLPILILTLFMAMPVSASAKVKLNKTKSTLYVGQTTTLKVKGTSKSVKWSSSKKKVASVSSKGKVTAKKAGSATITAKVGKKKYTCKVTVKTNEYIYYANMDNPSVWKQATTLKSSSSSKLKAYPSYMTYDSDGNLIMTLAVRNTSTNKSFKLKSLKVYLYKNDGKTVIAGGYFSDDKLKQKIGPEKTVYVPLKFNNNATKKYVILKDLDFKYSVATN